MAEAPVHRGWRIALAGWLATFACLVAVHFSIHEDVRVLAPFLAQPWLHRLLVFSLLATTVVAIGRYLRRSRRPGRRWPSAGSVACAVLAAPWLALALYIVLLNWKIERDQAGVKGARVGYDPSGPALSITGSLRRNVAVLVRESFAQAPDIRQVTLRSHGGEMVVARYLGEFLREREVTVRVDDYCASACALVWARAARREARVGSRIGLHQSHLGRGDRGPGLVRRGLDAKRSDYDAALRDAGFPEQVIAQGARTLPDDMYWVSVLELAGQGVEVQFIGADGQPLSLAQARALWPVPDPEGTPGAQALPPR
jgi:hypothetical protein